MEKEEKPCFDFSSLSGCENIFPLANHYLVETTACCLFYSRLAVCLSVVA